MLFLEPGRLLRIRNRENEGTAYGKARVSHCACAMLICHKQAPLPQPNPPPPSDFPPISGIISARMRQPV